MDIDLQKCNAVYIYIYIDIAREIKLFKDKYAI